MYGTVVPFIALAAITFCIAFAVPVPNTFWNSTAAFCVFSSLPVITPYIASIAPLKRLDINLAASGRKDER